MHSAPVAALLCVLLACLGLYLAPSTSSSITSSQPGPYIRGAVNNLPDVVPNKPVISLMTAEPLAETGAVPATMSEALAVSIQHNRMLARPYIPGAADYLPDLLPNMLVMIPANAEPLAETDGVPTTMSEALAVSPWHNRMLAGPYILSAANYFPDMVANMPFIIPLAAEPLAEAGVVPATMSEALALSPWHNRALARPAAALKWVRTPLQLSSGPETAAGLSGRQPAASALGSSVPGMQSVLLGVQDVTPDMFGSMPLIMRYIVSWIPAMVPGAVDTSLEGEEAPAGWQQHSIPNGFASSSSALVSIQTLPLGFKYIVLLCLS